MANKTLNTRIKLKYDLYSNWSTNNPVLLAGEVALAYIPTDSSLSVGNTSVNGTTPPQVLIKVGDGTNHYNDLKYTSALAADVLTACKSEAALTTFVNGVIADAGIASSDAMESLADRVNTVENDITTLNGDSSTTGSVAKQIADAIAALNLASTYAAKSHTHLAADVTDLDETIQAYDYATKTEAEGYANAKDDAIAEAKKAGTDASAALNAYKTEMTTALAGKQDVIPEDTYDAYGAATAAENNAKSYVDQKFTDANLDQYTTENEVKSIVDGVIAAAADDETYNSLTKLVDYIDAHGGEAAEMATAIEALEGKITTIEGKPAHNITSSQISNWDNEVGAKELAETKTTTAAVKTQIEAYGYATTTYADQAEQDAKDYADTQIEALALGTMSKETATDYVKKSEAQGYTDILTKTEAQTTYQAKGSYAAAEHTHQIADVTGLQTALDAKANDADLKPVAKSGLIDDLSIGEGTVLIFNCGTSAV